MKTQQFQWSAATSWEPPLPSDGAGTDVQVVFLFGSAPLLDAQRHFSAARAAFPKAHIIGCSTAGEICDTRVCDDTITLTALQLERSSVRSAHAAIADVEASFSAGQNLARQLDPRGLRHVFVLSEGLQVHGNALVAGINSVLPPHVTISGGFAGDGMRLQSTYVWSDHGPQQRAVAALGFYGEHLKVGVSATGGWGPFGPDRLITRSKRNVLFEFDGRPALSLYKQYLGEHAAGLPASGLMFPLDLRIGDRPQRVLRAILGVDEAEQSITFAGDVPEGSYARLMVGHIEKLIDGTVVAAQASAHRLGDVRPEFSLLVSCNGRRMVLKQRVEEEVEAVREILGDQAALAGFYSYGEIAPAEGGAVSELHNETMTITSFAET